MLAGLVVQVLAAVQVYWTHKYLCLRVYIRVYEYRGAVSIENNWQCVQKFCGVTQMVHSAASIEFSNVQRPHVHFPAPARAVFGVVGTRPTEGDGAS
jgi:hypothetical protein